MFFHLRVNAQGLGLKRSVTTLRGGTLGYAEIVALKVKPPRDAKAAAQQPTKKPKIFQCFLTVYILIFFWLAMVSCSSTIYIICV